MAPEQQILAVHIAMIAGWAAVVVIGVLLAHLVMLVGEKRGGSTKFWWKDDGGFLVFPSACAPVELLASESRSSGGEIRPLECGMGALLGWLHSFTVSSPEGASLRRPAVRAEAPFGRAKTSSHRMDSSMIPNAANPLLIGSRA